MRGARSALSGAEGFAVKGKESLRAVFFVFLFFLPLTAHLEPLTYAAPSGGAFLKIDHSARSYALGGVSGNKSSGGASSLFEGLSSGIGLRLGMARIDYAVGQQSADLGISQRLSLTLQFGKKAN